MWNMAVMVPARCRAVVSLPSRFVSLFFNRRASRR